MQKVKFEDLGRISYKKAWDYQQGLMEKLVEEKLVKRKAEIDVDLQKPPLHRLLFCEHDPVYTLGKSGSMENLLLNDSELAHEGIEFFKINRGGDITFHGLGQIVGYPIFDLDYFFTDVHKYVRFLEEAVLLTLRDYGIKGMRIEKYTGVWLPAQNGLPERKICAIGVHLRRWVTLHGFAFNVNTELNYFNNIIPCGIQENNKDVTSMEKELGREIDIDEVKNKLKAHLAKLFGFEFVNDKDGL